VRIADEYKKITVYIFFKLQRSLIMIGKVFMSSKLKSIFLLTLTPLLTVFATPDVVVLKNGDRISGTITKQTDEHLVIESPVFGAVTVHMDELASGGLPEESIPVDTGEVTAEDAEADTSSASKEASIMSDWLAWTRSWLPSGWSGELRFGYFLTQSSDRETGVSLGLGAKKQSGKHTFEAGGFYDYERNKNPEGTVSKPTDKYGADLLYEYDIRDPFFIGASVDALVDRVKRIKLQSDQAVLAGWRILNQPNYGFDVAAGPGARYQENLGESGDWTTMGTFRQDAFYVYEDAFRLGQKFDSTVSLENSNDYSYLFEISATALLTPWAQPRLIYRNSYDSNVGVGGTRREQSLLVSLTIPF